LFREVLHDVYIPPIQRGDSSFAANVPGARGALPLVLAHFFENGCWGLSVETPVRFRCLAQEIGWPPSGEPIIVRVLASLTARMMPLPSKHSVYKSAQFRN